MKIVRYSGRSGHRLLKTYEGRRMSGSARLQEVSGLILEVPNTRAARAMNQCS